MKYVIIKLCLVWSVSLSALAISPTEMADKIKQARLIVQEMSDTASSISNQSKHASMSLSNGSLGAPNVRENSSNLPNSIGADKADYRQQYLQQGKAAYIPGQGLTDVVTDENLKFDWMIAKHEWRKEAIRKARFYSRQSILKNKKAESESSDSIGSIVLLVLFSMLFI